MTSSTLVDHIFSSLCAQLQQPADPARAEAQRRYFKEPMEAKASRRRQCGDE
ncbi:MAG: hypothetical protein HYY02_13365 [Chloroflexi bacterium]|nr:hypothetical protein [Chloroflexota bacterium]